MGKAALYAKIKRKHLEKEKRKNALKRSPVSVTTKMSPQKTMRPILRTSIFTSTKDNDNKKTIGG